MEKSIEKLLLDNPLKIPKSNEEASKNYSSIYNVKLKKYENGSYTLITYRELQGRIPTEKKYTPKGKGISEQNIYKSMVRSKNSIYDLARSNLWEYFITITLDKKNIDRYDYDLISKKLSQKIKNIKRDYAPNLKYLIVPEQHKDGAWHFHGLLSDIGTLEIKETKNVSSVGKVYILPQVNLGYSTATKIVDTVKVSNYITKYVTKGLIVATFDKKRYWHSRNLKKPKVSLHWIQNFKTKELIESTTPTTNSFIKKNEYATYITSIL